MTVENGEGLQAADSYATVAFADTYHAARANASWADATLAQKEAALIKASSWLDGRYLRRYPGLRLTSQQGLGWPRYDAVDVDGYTIDGVPFPIQRATCEMALRALTEDIEPDLERGGKVVTETVGPISTTYADNAPTRTTYPQIDGILKRVLVPAELRIVRTA